MDEGDSPPLSASHTLWPYEMTAGMPSWAGMPAADSMARKLLSEPSALAIGANSMAAAVTQAVVTPNSSREVCFVFTIRSCYVFVTFLIGSTNSSPLLTPYWFPYNHLCTRTQRLAATIKKQALPSNEGKAQTTAGPPPGIASYEGADVVTASEARKVARRLMCAGNEIDRLSGQDCPAARRADA